MAEKWISKAIRRPGQLHRDLNVPQGKRIPQAALAKALAGDYGAATARRARLAKTLGKMNK